MSDLSVVFFAPDLGDDGLQPQAGLDIAGVLRLFFIGLLARVDDCREVRLDGKPAIVAAGEQVGDDFADITVTVACHGVLFRRFLVEPEFGVLDVDVHDLVFDQLVPAPRIGAVGGWIAGVKQHLKRRAVNGFHDDAVILHTNAAPAGAVLVSQDNTLTFGDFDQLAHPAHRFFLPIGFGHGIVLIVGPAHDPKQRVSHFQRPGQPNGHDQVVSIGSEISGNRSRPVADFGVQTRHFQARHPDFRDHPSQYRRFQRQNRHAAYSAQLDVGKAQILVGFDLGANAGTRFIGNS